MAQRHLEWAERMVELWNSGDLEAWLDEVGSDFEFTPDPSFPDVGSYKGEELRDWMRSGLAPGGTVRDAASPPRGRWHLDDPGFEIPLGHFSSAPSFDHEQALRLAEEETG